MENIKLSAFIDEYSDELDIQIDALKKYGIEYVELRHCNGKNVAEFSTEDILTIKEETELSFFGNRKCKR